jgi:YbbR domain-containing protein
MTTTQVRDTIINNLVWLLASFVVALLVWVVAKIEANPIDQRQFFSVPVTIQYNEEEMVITNDPRDTVRVIVRAQQSVLDLLAEEDITVTADLADRTPGSHTVPLEVSISRPASADTIPTQINVELAQLIAQQKPVEISVQPPPVNFEYENLTRDIQQARVEGASEDVSAVTRVQAELDLSDVRNPVERTIPLVALNAEGNTVSNITIEPRNVTVSVDVSQRDDVLRAAVRPFILAETLAETYQFELEDWTPRQVFITGPEDELAALGGTVPTEPISLEGRTADFELTVPLDLPEGNLRVLPDPDADRSDNTVTVEIALIPQTASVQIDDINIELIGTPDDYTATVNPSTISILLNGPVTQVQEITPQDVTAIIDLNNYEPGTYDLAPSIDFGDFSFGSENITRIPPTASVTIAAPTPEATAEATDNPPAETTPEATAESD